MKVLLFNGSPRKESNTGIALAALAEELNAAGVETEEIRVGNQAISGCKACGACSKLGRCVQSDFLNEVLDKVAEADGYVFGTPVYYASPNGTLISFLDRLFMTAGKSMQFKPAASVAVARRAGTVSSYDVLNKYIGINSMIQVPAPYWNDVYGRTPGEAEQDLEGLSVMRALGQNMAWILKMMEVSQANGVEHPQISKEMFNYIR